MQATVIDTETTGLNPDKDKLVEVAVAYRDKGIITSRSSFINPGIPIPPEVSGLHHITDKDVVNAPLEQEVFGFLNVPEGLLIAHNSKFDRAFLPRFKDRQFLCTYRTSMHLYPDAPNHKNQVLRYYLGLDPYVPPNMAPHRAEYDCLVTLAIFEHMVKSHTIQDLLALQDKPVIQKTVKFGKHRSQLWRDVPRDYMQWCLRQDDSGGIDSDIKATCSHYLRGGL